MECRRSRQNGEKRMNDDFAPHLLAELGSMSIIALSNTTIQADMSQNMKENSQDTPAFFQPPHPESRTQRLKWQIQLHGVPGSTSMGPKLAPMAICCMHII